MMRSRRMVAPGLRVSASCNDAGKDVIPVEESACSANLVAHAAAPVVIERTSEEQDASAGERGERFLDNAWFTLFGDDGRAVGAGVGQR